jgi:hypothetical protein
MSCWKDNIHDQIFARVNNKVVCINKYMIISKFRILNKGDQNLSIYFKEKVKQALGQIKGQKHM